MNRIKVGILGATGMAGQRYLELLNDHPYFDVCYLAASPRSANKKYKDAVRSRWILNIVSSRRVCKHHCEKC